MWQSLCPNGCAVLLPHPCWHISYLQQPMLQPTVYPQSYRPCQGMGWQGISIAGWPLQLQLAPTLLEAGEATASTQLICPMATPSPQLCCSKCLCHHMAHQPRELSWLENHSGKARQDLTCVIGMDKREKGEWSQLQPAADKPLITSATPSE